MKKIFKEVAIICVLLIMAIFATVGCAKKKDNDTNVGEPGNDEYSPVSSMTLSDTEAAALNNSVKVKVYYKTVKETSNSIRSWFTDNNGNTPYNTAGRYTKLGKHELFPIPQRDMDLCEQFVQNPNWN